MLRLVINPGGESRIVKIEEALKLCGFDMRGRDGWTARTPEERRRQKRAADRAYRERHRRTAL